MVIDTSGLEGKPELEEELDELDDEEDDELDELGLPELELEDDDVGVLFQMVQSNRSATRTELLRPVV